MAPVEAAARTVSFTGFPAQFSEERDELLAAVTAVFERGDFVGGRDVAALEDELAAWLDAAHVVAVNSGTDALLFALVAAGVKPGDDVITPSNSFIASTATIVHVGAKPVFADVLPDQMIDPAAIEAAITPRTTAIMPVHLTGRVADMTAIDAIARKHGLAVIEDAAQSIGSAHRGRKSGTFGAVGAFSAHPLKNLNAAGDGGFVVTNDPAIARRARSLRNHGLVDRDTVEAFGFCSRLDTLQAAVLRVRLRRLPDVIARRRALAAIYERDLDRDRAWWPAVDARDEHTYHLFVVQVDERAALIEHLAARGVQTKVHYPIPIHLQPASRGLGYARGSLPETERQSERILSLPIHQTLSADDVAYVAASVNGFFT